MSNIIKLTDYEVGMEVSVLRSGPTAQVCDATKSLSDSSAGIQKIFIRRPDFSRISPTFAATIKNKNKAGVVPAKTVSNALFNY